jgi:hypothetical protein
MVLLSNNNPLNIKQYHMLQCLQKKKESFNIFVLPLNKTLDETIEKNNNIDMNMNINYEDIKILDSMFGSSKNK